MGRAGGVAVLFAANEDDDAALNTARRSGHGFLLRRVGLRQRQRSERKDNCQRAGQKAAWVRGMDGNCVRGVLPLGEQTIAMDRIATEKTITYP